MRLTNLGRLRAVLTTSLLVSFSALVTALATARALGPSGRGELASVIAPFLVLAAIVGGGLPYAVASRRDGDPDTARRAISTGVAMALALGVVAALMLVTWAGVVGDGRGAGVLLVSAALPAAIVLAVFLEYERQRGAGRIFNQVRLTTAILGAGVTFSLMVVGVDTVWPFATAITFPSIVVVAVLVFRRVGIFQWRAISFDSTLARGLWTTASRAWPSAITDTLLLRADQVLLAVTVEPHVLGLYAVAATVAESGGLIRHALCATYYSRLAAAAEAELRRVWQSMLLRLFVLAVPAYVLLGLLAHLMLVRLLGDTFADIGPILSLLLVAQLALDLHLTSGTVLLARGRPGAFSRTSLLAVSVHLFALIPGVFFFGVFGACCASLIGYASAAALTHRATARLTNPLAHVDSGDPIVAKEIS